MHTIHHTDAFIVKSQPAGEANRRLWLFTKELGLVIAAVQGVRKQGAKLAMHTSDYSLISADLVRGKEVWRLTTAQEIENPFIGKDPNGLGRAFIRTLSVVDRFCQGEEAHPELFDHLQECLAVIATHSIDPKAFDTLSVWKVMVLLGYSAVAEEDRALFSLPLPDAAQLLTEAVRKRLIKEVNETITQTHL